MSVTERSQSLATPHIYPKPKVPAFPVLSFASLFGSPAGGLFPFQDAGRVVKLTSGRISAALMIEVRKAPSLKGLRFLVEPGRYLVGEGGIYLARINDIKVSRGKKFLILAGGMNHHLAASGNLGQVIKKLRKDRIVTVGRKLVIGSTWKLEDALLASEDSTKLNTSFIERLNLTIRRGCSYLARKTTGHARVRRTLVEQLELFRCYYNFIRPHSSLRFGREVRTPAMQAGSAANTGSRRRTWVGFLGRDGSP